MVAKDKIVINVDGEKFTINLPKDSGIEIREQQNCQSKGHICALFHGQKVCWEPILKPDKEGNLEIGEIKACSKNPNFPKIEIEG